MAALPENPDRVWILDVLWESRGEARYSGAVYDPDLKMYMWTGSQLPGPLRQFRSQPFSWERWVEDNLNEWQSGTAGGKFQLRKHQFDAADAIASAHRVGRPGFLLADDVGLGKTLSALAGVSQIGQGLRVLVLCPLSVVPHWRSSIAMFGTFKSRFCVINYDRAKKLLEEPQSAKNAKRKRTRNKRHADTGRSLVNWDVVICDEAHGMRNPVSQRSAAVRQIVKGKSDDPAFVVWASATAGQNPLELSYLAPLLASVTGHQASSLDDFEAWCEQQGIMVKRGAYGKYEWIRNERDLQTIHDLLFTGSPAPGIRRRPTDIAGWPEQQRVLHDVQMSPMEKVAYFKAWTEFRSDYRLALRGPDPTNPMVVQLRFRQKASLLRAPHVATQVVDLLDSGMQVAVSCEFLETVELLREMLDSKGIPTAVITGKTPPAEREQQRLAFQRGECIVCLFTVTEGISLHAGETAAGANMTPRVTVVADPRWSALAMLQIEGRCHRDGQNALVYIAHAAGTIETKVVTVLMQRMTSTKTMVGDDTETLREIEAEITHQLDFGTSAVGSSPG